MNDKVALAKRKITEIKGIVQKHTHIYSQLIFNKGVDKRQWEKDNHFNKLCWQNWISTCKITKLNPPLKP